MGTTITTSQFKNQSFSLTKKLLPWTLYALIPIALFHFYFYHSPVFQSSTLQLLDDGNNNNNNSPIILASPMIHPSREKKMGDDEIECDYKNGKWVRENLGPLYNGTSCKTIKDGQNCIDHGRSDLGYLNWRWKPHKCHLPRFEPDIFLQLVKNKHIAFVGDSMARNQLESLLCLLSSVSSPVLVYNRGSDNKFRRWSFQSHNVTISIYWSPFLVKGVEKSNTGFNHNKLYMDRVDDNWAKDLGGIDIILFSIGHWFLHPAVYYEGDSVLGCHYCPDMNHTEIGFYKVFGRAFNTTLRSIVQNRASPINVFVTTFSPSHFEGDWDKLGACSKTKPYEEEEKVLEEMDNKMREIELKEVALAKRENHDGLLVNIEALDITKLALLRPDGHPGPYMYPFPFANGVSERVQNDCVHWCLPGPIDTWNEILLMVLKRNGRLNQVYN